MTKLGDLWQKLGERDFSAHITAMLNAKPDAVFSSVWGGDLIAFIKQANAYGFFRRCSSSPPVRAISTSWSRWAGRERKIHRRVQGAD